ncbi:hypothetical protein [Burkholderia mayonis]|nr:hypothetical protein [Burkholderia mayonis]
MTESEYLAAVNAAIARWLLDRKGEPLTAKAFAQAEPARCHANADAYVIQHGGQVVRGFLILHPHEWTVVWVMPHSVVRTATGLVDVTLKSAELRGLAFFSIEGDPERFIDWAKRYPQESRSVVQSQ